MAPRPAKRQRRSTVLHSDDDDDFELPSARAANVRGQREITRDGKTSVNVSPVKTGKGRSAPKLPAPKPSPKSSPEKVKKASKAKLEPERSKSLHNFFTKATEEERWRKRSATPDVGADLENGELGDAIEDDELSDETLQELGLRTDKTPAALLDRRKPSLPALAHSKNGIGGAALPSSQRFVKSVALKDTVKIKVEEQDLNLLGGHRPWADRYGPNNLDELVVHKKKVADVRGWLDGRVTGKHSQKVLILKGPAGSGKTTTVSLLANSMGLELISWHNPVVSDAGPNHSIALQFDEFLNRGGQFGGLTFEGDDASGSSTTGTAGRILMIEEFPATITRSSSTLQAFRSVFLRYLSRQSTAHPTGIRGHQAPGGISPPVVIIISETLLSSSTALADSFTAHRLMGPEILNHPYVTAMDFNPVAPTFVTKALDLVVKKEARESGRRRMPGPGVMQRLAEMNDVRSAVNALEFLCLRSGDGSEWSGTVAAKPKRSAKDREGVPLTEMEKKSLQLVAQRESTLDMFHAAGKIVYNKREDPRVQDTRAEPPPKPPDHLMHLYSPKASLVDIEALLNETGTDIQTYISTLHENYILSCNGDAFEESFGGCSDSLSTSDVLNPDSRPSRRANNNPNATLIQSNLQAGSSDTLRQDEISFHAATRGLLFNLPYPVNRASVPGGKRGDNFKMFYPQSLRLWKPIEEMDSLIEMFGSGTTISHSALGPLGSVVPGVDAGVASWQSRSFLPSRSISHNDGDEDVDDDATLPYREIRYNKDVLTLELLPYMRRIPSIKKEDMKIIDRITSFKPSAFLPTAMEGEDSFESEADTKEALSLQRPTLTSPLRAGKTTSGSGATTRPRPFGLVAPSNSLRAFGDVDGSAAPAIDKLYLEDDDIVDD